MAEAALKVHYAQHRTTTMVSLSNDITHLALAEKAREQLRRDNEYLGEEERAIL